MFNVWHLIDAIGYWVTSRSPSLLRLRKYRWCGILIYRLNDQSHSFLFVLLRALFVGSSPLLQLFFLFPVVESSQRMIRMTSSPPHVEGGELCGVRTAVHENVRVAHDSCVLVVLWPSLEL